MCNSISPNSLSTAANRRLGLYLFLLSLSILFATSLVAYLIIQLGGSHTTSSVAMHLPTKLWISTIILLFSGWTFHRAGVFVRQREALGISRNLILTCALGLAFLGIQGPCMVELLATHYYQITQYTFGTYGLAFGLILIHALHIIGGIIPLIILTCMSWRRTLTPSHYPTLEALITYWHFLEIIWIMLFGVFLITL